MERWRCRKKGSHRPRHSRPLRRAIQQGSAIERVAYRMIRSAQRPSRPMNVCLTDEQKLLQQTVREFAEAELRPHVMEWDEAQAFPRQLLDKLAALGLMGIQFPEQYGGSAMSAVDYCICIE